MGKNKNKKFGKHAEEVRHFRLVARSQTDGYAEDPDASPLVLEPFAPPGAQRKTGLSEAELLQLPKSLEALGPDVFSGADGRCPEPLNANKGSYGIAEESGEEDADDLAELDGDCYFPKDGYNYEQHLKRVSGAGKKGGVVGVVLDAPQPVKKEEIKVQEATNEEEAAALRALEFADEYDAFDEEDEDLDGLMAGGVVQDETEVLWGPAALADSNLPDLAFFRRAAQEFDDEGGEEYEDEYQDGNEASASGKGRGSAPGAAEFDKFLAAEYGDEELGACEEEDIEGPVELEDLEAVLDEYIEENQQEKELMSSIYEPIKGKLDDVPRVIDETKAIIAKHYSQEGIDDEETSSGEDSDEDESKNWDCETILSTLSNLSNRPGKIGRLKIVKKPSQALKPVQESEAGNGSEEDEDDEGVVELPDVITVRPKGETAEERKLRKASVKEMRRVCRQMKKESKETYKAEAAKMTERKAGGCDVRTKARTFKL